MTDPEATVSTTKRCVPLESIARATGTTGTVTETGTELLHSLTVTVAVVVLSVCDPAAVSVPSELTLNAAMAVWLLGQRVVELRIT